MSAADLRDGRDDWDAHWTNYHETASLNPAQEFRRKLVLYHLRRGAAGGRPRQIVDLGSGNGDFARVFLQRFPSERYLGLDCSQSGVEVASRKVPAASFLQRDLMEPQQPPAEFRGWADHAVCSEVLEHLDEPHVMIENIKPYLAPAARLIVTVPGGPMSAFDRHIGHRRHFSPPALAELLARGGYKVEGVWGAGFPFFNLYRLTVIARGRKLVNDAAQSSGFSYHLSRLVMRCFGVLFSLNRYRSRYGWQTVGVARYPG